jgi:hypothetical protein
MSMFGQDVLLFFKNFHLLMCLLLGVVKGDKTDSTMDVEAITSHDVGF